MSSLETSLETTQSLTFEVRQLFEGEGLEPFWHCGLVRSEVKAEVQDGDDNSQGSHYEYKGDVYSCTTETKSLDSRNREIINNFKRCYVTEIFLI